MGRVADYLSDRLRDGPIHFTLIDPEKSPGSSAGEIAEAAVQLGTHAILLGGSTGISPDGMGAAARAVKAKVQVPVIIFPEGPGSLSADADAVLFMSLLNSRSVDLVIRLQARSSVAIRSMGLEAIPLGYLVVAPGMKVGEVGQADAIPRDRSDQATGYALAAELLGMRLVYLEAGSGAPAPVPVAMVTAVRGALSIPLVVGGGIRTGEQARTLLDAGAQVLVTGTVTEEAGIGTAFRSILGEVGRARGVR